MYYTQIPLFHQYTQFLCITVITNRLYFRVPGEAHPSTRIGKNVLSIETLNRYEIGHRLLHGIRYSILILNPRNRNFVHIVNIATS